MFGPSIRPGIRRALRLAPRGDDRLGHEVSEELEHHLQLSIEQLVAGGMAPDAARSEALRRLGVGDDSPEGAERALHDVHRRLHVAAHRREDALRVRAVSESLALDLRQALRSARRAPRFACLVVLTLALGIGANASMFGLIDRLLLRGPAHVADAQRVLRLYTTAHLPGEDEATHGSFSYAAYVDLRDAARSYAQVAAYTPGGIVSVGRGDGIQRLYRQNATWTLFPLLGVRPHLGRFFTETEDRPPVGQAVAVLGFAAWKHRFGADTAIIGRAVHLGGVPVTVVGVAPEGFTGAELRPVDLWLPASFTQSAQADWPTARDRLWLRVVGRLAPGVTAAQAGDEATAIHRRAPTEGPAGSAAATARLSLRPLRFDARGADTPETRVASWLMAMAAMVLLISCANVANLLLARALVRRREIAVRLTLGVGRARLVRLLLLEGVVLTLAGGAAGLVLAHWGGTLVRATLLPDIAWSGSPVDGRMLLFTLAATIASALLAGLAPALRASRPELTHALRTGTPQTGAARSSLRTALTIAQAALSALLLVGAGLFVRSLWNVRTLDLGIETDRVFTVQWSWERPLDEFPAGRLRDGERTRRRAMRDRVVDDVARLPGVAAAALQKAVAVPLRVPGHDSLPVLPGGGPYAAGVSAGYFATVGTSILRGRAFTGADRAGSEPVAVVNVTMAHTLWPRDEPLGKCLVVGEGPTTCWRVVGVAEDTHRFALREEPAMQYYVPYDQVPGNGSLLVRPRGDPAALVPALRTTLRRLDPTLGHVDATLLQDAVEPQIRPWRLGATLLSLFGVLAMLMGAVGLYSVMSYVAAERVREFGVRMALGARPRDVRGLLFARGLGTAAAGILVGTAAALAGGRWLEPLLFDTSARDPAVFGSVAALLLVVAALATLVPAWRATRVDPAVALRSE